MEASRAPNRLRRRALGIESDERSFEQLYRRHAREVYQYALAVLANPADAEDVTQTTFLNAYRAFQRGERPRKPHNWLITIAHNVCRMRWRQAGARPREVALDEAPEPAAPDDERADLGEVLAALAQLSFNQRAALVMRELEGRSYREISDVLGVSVSAVEALLFRARRRLQVSRRALGALTTVPLPGSLRSFLGGGGGVVAAGGTLAGADLVLKAAAVVVAGAVTAGVGYKSVEAVTAPKLPQARASQVQPAEAKHSPATKRTAARPGNATGQTKKPRSAVATSRRVTRPARPTAGAGATAPQPSAGVTAPTPQTLVKPPVTVPRVTPPAITLPALPPPPQLPPPPPITLPTLPPPPPLPPPPLE